MKNKTPITIGIITGLMFLLGWLLYLANDMMRMNRMLEVTTQHDYQYDKAETICRDGVNSFEITGDTLTTICN